VGGGRLLGSGVHQVRFGTVAGFDPGGDLPAGQVEVSAVADGDAGVAGEGEDGVVDGGQLSGGAHQGHGRGACERFLDDRGVFHDGPRLARVEARRVLGQVVVGRVSTTA
jgi:hypothetical protein